MAGADDVRRITTHDVFGRAYEAGTDDLELSVHVYGLAVDGNKVLISPQWDGYDFPGGTVKKGETHIETLKREFKEETGYDVEPVELLFSSPYANEGLSKLSGLLSG